MQGDPPPAATDPPTMATRKTDSPSSRHAVLSSPSVRSTFGPLFCSRGASVFHDLLPGAFRALSHGVHVVSHSHMASTWRLFLASYPSGVSVLNQGLAFMPGLHSPHLEIRCSSSSQSDKTPAFWWRNPAKTLETISRSSGS